MLGRCRRVCAYLAYILVLFFDLGFSAVPYATTLGWVGCVSRLRGTIHNMNGTAERRVSTGTQQDVGCVVVSFAAHTRIPQYAHVKGRSASLSTNVRQRTHRTTQWHTKLQTDKETHEAIVFARGLTTEVS